jgi:hypothetical protein
MTQILLNTASEFVAALQQGLRLMRMFSGQRLPPKQVLGVDAHFGSFIGTAGSLDFGRFLNLLTRPRGIEPLFAPERALARICESRVWGFDVAAALRQFWPIAAAMKASASILMLRSDRKRRR